MVHLARLGRGLLPRPFKTLFLLCFLLCAFALPVTIAQAASEQHVCRGQVATIVGTELSERLRGTKGNDVIVSLGGNDVIITRGGDDIVCSGDGHDVVNHKSGTSYTDTGAGNDRVRQKSGNATVSMGIGNDSATLGRGNDRVLGDLGSDYVIGGLGQNACTQVEKRIRCYKDGSNQRPIAAILGDTAGLPNAESPIDGTSSYDPDGSLITYQWSIVSAPQGANATFDDDRSPKPNVEGDIIGEYIVELVVNDGQLDSYPARAVYRVADVAVPTAQAGRDRFVRTHKKVTLDGSTSTDPSGHLLTYQWEIVEKPKKSRPRLSEADTATPKFKPKRDGTYIFRLSVNNGVSSDEDYVQITAKRSNIQPTANAGRDVDLVAGDTATLDGSGSDDPNPAGGSGYVPWYCKYFGNSGGYFRFFDYLKCPNNKTTYEWRLVSKPGDSSLNGTDITDADKETASILPDVPGDYVLRLAISNRHGADQDFVLVRAANPDEIPPVISFLSPTDGQTIGDLQPTFLVDYFDAESGLDLPTFSLTINGVDVTATTDVGEDQASYPSGADLPEGANTATAAITDLAGNVATVTINFTVSPGGTFQAIADCAPLQGEVPLVVRFRSRGTFEGGSIISYAWDFDGDGTTNLIESVPGDHTFTFQQAGTFTPMLTVTNNLGATASDTCTIDATGNAPTATADASPSNGAIPLDVNFTCTGSDPNGSIALYEWDFEGDGTFDFSSATSGSATHTYASEGEFEAICRVTDDEGLTGTARTITTTIRSGPAGSPSVTASASPSTGTSAPLTVSFNGTATDDGTIVLYEWDFDGDGTFDFSSPTSPATNFTYDDAGFFAAALRVTDDSGLTSTDNVEISVGITVTLTIADDTFEPEESELLAIQSQLTAGAPIRTLILNEAGATVRTLFDGARAAGTHQDDWDGKDDSSADLPDGLYFVVLEYDFDGKTIRVDPSDTSGGLRYSPSRARFPNSFSPYEDDLLNITFTIPDSRGTSEVTAFIGTFFVNTRFRTLLDRVPFGAGTHTIFWDGLDASGNFAVPPPGDQFLFGIFGITSPDNAVYLKRAPIISNVSVDPNFFDPATFDFSKLDQALAKITFDLDKTSNVELVVTNLKTAKELRRILVPSTAAGTGLTIDWEGLADSGLFADAGDYRLSVRAVDSTGSPSITRHALVRVYY